MSNLASFIALVLLIGPSCAFLFFVTGKFWPFRLSDAWAKHCEACGSEWGVLYRRYCPRCGILIGRSNMFPTHRDWQIGRLHMQDDEVLARAFEIAAKQRRTLPRKNRASRKH